MQTFFIAAGTFAGSLVAIRCAYWWLLLPSLRRLDNISPWEDLPLTSLDMGSWHTSMYSDILRYCIVSKINKKSPVWCWLMIVMHISLIVSFIFVVLSTT